MSDHGQSSDDMLKALLAQGSLARDALADVKKQLAAGGDLKDVVVGRGLVDEETFTKIWAGVVKLPYVDLRDKLIARDVLLIIPESTAKGHLVITYQRTDKEVNLAAANPSDRQIIEFVRKKVGVPVTVVLASVSSIRSALRQYQGSLAGELEDVFDQRTSITPASDLGKVAQDAPTVRVIDAILRHAITEDASDIHLEPMESKVLVRYRIDGLLHDALELPRDMAPGLVARIKVLSSLKIDEHRLPQDGRFNLATPEYNIAFRVSVLPVYDGEKIVMRLLDESGQGLRLPDLGLREKPLAAVRSAAQKPYGMILVTGPTGSGKTTTLYAVMQELNAPDVNISTIEDPIEYRIARVNQTQVKPQIGLSFANGLRALVRQDPDIIMVGEIRDEETAALAVNAALTGHLVLSTLHTNTAAGALPRLLDMKVESFLLASTLNVVIGQRLVRRLCEHCRGKVKVDAALLAGLRADFDTDALLAVVHREGVVPKGDGWEDIHFYKPVGCTKCREGYKGRLGIYEVLAVTPEIQKMITSHTTSAELEEAARKDQGMVTMLEDGFIKIIAGVTSLEELLRAARE